MREVLVEACHISRVYGYRTTAITAVSDASCTIARGERIALVGSSGSGKSSLLHLLGGLDLPTSGDVTWPTLGSREDLRPQKVVDIFQGPSLLYPLTVLENCCLPLLLDGGTQAEAERLSMNMLEAFSIDELKNKLPSQISGGQAQRVSISRALAGSPSLILADEPTGQLDSQTALSVFNTMLQVAAACNAAIVVATHDRQVALMLDQQWSMSNGTLDADKHFEGFVVPADPSKILVAL